MFVHVKLVVKLDLTIHEVRIYTILNVYNVSFALSRF